MGIFGKSFKRELGKNTGRFVSNKIFGDGHASKSKIIHAGGLGINKFSAEKETKKMIESMEEAENRRLSQEEYKDAQELLSFKQDTLFSIKFGSDLDEITEALDKLLIIFNSDNDIEIQSSARSKALTGIFKLKSMGAIELAEHYRKQFPDVKKKEKLTITLIIIGCLLVLIGGAIASKLGYLD